MNTIDTTKAPASAKTVNGISSKKHDCTYTLIGKVLWDSRWHNAWRLGGGNNGCVYYRADNGRFYTIPRPEKNIKGFRPLA